MKLLAPPSGSLLASILLCAGATCAQPAPLPLAAPAAEGYSAERLQRLATFMRGATAADGYLGGVVLIARHGHIVDWQAYGHADLARMRPMARDSIFRIYSMTKTIASAAAMTLVEEGRIGLDDPVRLTLPGFASVPVHAGGNAAAPQTRPSARPITIRHLLTHTAGFATGGAGFEVPSAMLRTDLHGSASLQEYAARVASVPLAADPGTRFAYDGVNIEVLARVVEVVSGMPFDAFVQQRILGPLKMIDTGWRVPPAQRGRVVDITTMSDAGRLVRASGRSAEQPGEPLNPYPSGAGGLYSTAADYARFAQMLLNGGTLDGVTVLGRKTVELMMTNQLGLLEPPGTPPTFSPGEGFGLGGSVVTDVARRGRLGSLGQYGWTGAASTYYTVDPREQIVAILLLQHLPRDSGADLPKMSVRFYNLVYQALVP